MSDYRFRHFLGDESALGQLMSFCEIHCVSMCCGPNAYETGPDHVSAWVRSVDPAVSDAARRDVAELIRALGDAPDRFFFLDAEHEKSEVAEFFAELASGLDAAKAAG